MGKRVKGKLIMDFWLVHRGININIVTHPQDSELLGR
jgi:hypothetical protein